MSKPPTNRIGTTRTYSVGHAHLHVTLNSWLDGGELFAKYSLDEDAALNLIERVRSDDKRTAQAAVQELLSALQAPQGYLDRLCTVASLQLQGRADWPTIARHLAGDQTWPTGGIREPRSCIDALARAIGDALKEHKAEEGEYDEGGGVEKG